MALTLDFTGAVIAISGVTSGIGLETARVFAKTGATVCGCGRSLPDSRGARSFAEIVRAEGAVPLYVSADLQTTGGAHEFVRSVLGEHGRIDAVVSNAGRNAFSGTEATLDEWQSAIDLNLRSHWLLAKESLPALRSSAASPVGHDVGSPSFLVNSSNHSFYTIPGCFPYNVAKAGLNALVQSLCIECGPAVRAVGVAPGYIETEAAGEWFGSFPDPAEARRRIETMHPVGRMGSGEEIGGLFAFLASRYANFVSGTTWVADGGRSAMMQDGGKEYVTAPPTPHQ